VLKYLTNSNRVLLFATFGFLLFSAIMNTNLWGEIVEQDFVSISNLIDRYESAYSQKDVKGMIECCDKDSEWFAGLEDSMKKEFDRYQYIRIGSKEKKLGRDPQGKREDDLVAIRRALYIAYLDSEAPKVGTSQNVSASLNEYYAVYYLTRTPTDGKWKIRMFGQMAADDQIAYLTGKQFSQHGKIQDAFSEYKKAITINPEYSPAYSGLSDLSFAMGNLTDSIKYAEKAVELRPDVGYYHYSLGMIYLYAKDKEKSLKEFEKTKELDKDFPDIDLFIKNVDRIMSVSDAKMQAEQINENIAKVLAIKIEGTEDSAIIKDLNLMVTKPKKWVFIPRTDWHIFAAMSTVERPSLTDPIINISVRPLTSNNKSTDINTNISKNLAAVFSSSNMIILGKTEKKTIAGIQACEDFFAYTVEGTPVIAVVTTFEKNKMAYSIIYSDKAKDMQIDVRPYKEIIDGIKFIDSNKDVSDEIVNNFIAAERSKK
jgi:tetratricopeptide (TPR) repeat protein